MSTVNRRMSLRSSYLDRLKQKLKLLLDATTDLPSTKTRASGKRGVIFRNTIPGLLQIPGKHYHIMKH